MEHQHQRNILQSAFVYTSGYMNDVIPFRNCVILSMVMKSTLLYCENSFTIKNLK